MSARSRGALCPRCRPSPTQGGNLGVIQPGWGWRCPSCGHRWQPVVLQPAPMAAPKNPRGGRPRKQGGPTKSFPVRLSEARRQRYEALAAKWGCDLAEAMRRATDTVCDAEGITPTGLPHTTEGE